MRRINHPGPVAGQRRATVNCGIRQAEVTLSPGQSLLTAFASVLEENTATSGVARLHGGSFNSFAYCMPALSQTPDHAVYYSDTYRPEGNVRLENAAVTVGLRNGKPWIHCHGIWQDAMGRRLGGHVLPEEAIISGPIDATVWLLDGAAFDVLPDPETGFSLFSPVPVDTTTRVDQGPFVMSVRPNEDFCTALEAECRGRGISSAVVHGGVGSLVGTTFDDGTEVVPFVTEVYIQNGIVKNTGRDEWIADIDVSLVDNLGFLSEGKIKRGENPVLVTFEMLVEPIAFMSPT